MSITEGKLPDVSTLTLDEVEGLDLGTALDAILTAPQDCANSFQSTI